MEQRQGYKKTKLGWIPEDWEVVSLGLITKKIGSGSTPRGGEKVYTDKGIPFIRSQNVFNDSLQMDSLKYISDEIHYKMRNTVVLPNDVLLNITGASIGRSCVVPSYLKEGNVNQHVCIIRPNENLHSSYLQLFLSSFLGQKNIYKEQVGGNREGLNHSSVRAIKIPLPPLPEQRKIATILSTWDKAIRLLEGLIAKKQQLKKGLMQQLLTGKVRFKEFVQEEGFKDSKLGIFASDWQVVKIGDLYNRLSSGATPSRRNPDYFKGDILWVTSGELNYNLIKNTIEKVTQKAVSDTNLKIYAPGTFLIAITGLEAAGTRGSCAVLDKEATVNQSCMAFPVNDKLDTKFLFQFYFHFGEKIAFRFAQGTKQQSLNSKIMQEIPIPIPSSTEQTKIAQVLSTCDREIDLLQQQLAQTKAQKKGLMQQLLTGAVRVAAGAILEEKE